jgi:hypothetical protein
MTAYVTTYVLRVEVHDGDNGCTASFPDDIPYTAWGETPVAALAALLEIVKEWPITGADRWLAIKDGTAFGRTFCPTFRDGCKPSDEGAS